jgi:hypothetical protein
MPDASQTLHVSMPDRIISTTSKVGRIGNPPYLPPRLLEKLRSLGCNKLCMHAIDRYRY